MDLTALDGRPVHDDLRRLAYYCASLEQAHALPRWQEFRPVEVGWMLKRLAVIEILDGGSDYYYRLGGGLLPQIFGANLMGKRLSEAPDEVFRRTAKAVYDELVRTSRLFWAEGILQWPDGISFRVEYLLIPFRRNGTSPEIILAGVVSDIPDEELALYRGKGIGRLVPGVAAEHADSGSNV